LPGRKKRGGA